MEPEWIEELGPGRRTDPRLYFHDGETPLEIQSSGVPAQMRVPGLLFDELVGRAIVKDLSLGGVGFIAFSRYALPDRLLLLLGDCPPLYCQILHRRLVAPQLCFYGARWYQSERTQLEAVLARWQAQRAQQAQASA